MVTETTRLGGAAEAFKLSNDLHRASWWTRLLPWGPFLCAAAWCAGLLTERSNPWNGLTVVLPMVAAVIAASVWVLRTTWCDRDQQTIVALCILMTVWMWAVDLLSPHSLPMSLWRSMERTAALGVAVAAIAGRLNPRAFLSHAAAMAITCCSLVVLGWLWKGPNTPHALVTTLGFGGINACLTVAVPALAAWGTWLFVRRNTGEGVSTWAWAALAVAGLLLATIAWALERRGPLVAILTVVMFHVARVIWLKGQRGLVLSASLLLVALISGWLLLKSQDALWLHARGLRLLLYQASFTLASHGPIWGWGDYGAVQLQWFEDQRTLRLNQMEWYLHAHNDVLDAAISGGPIAAALLLTISALITRRVINCKDRALGLAAASLGLALLVHSMTDNSYGQPVGTLWCAACLGFFLTLPVDPKPARRFPSPAWIVVSTAPVAIWGALESLPMAMLPRSALLETHAVAHSRLLHPEVVRGELLQRVGSGYPLQHPSIRKELESALRKMGPSGELPWLLALSLRSEWGQEAKRLELVAGYLERRPFLISAYAELQSLLTLRPDLTTQVSPAIVGRLPLIFGHADARPREGPGAPKTVPELADLWASAIWHLRRRHEPEALAPIEDAMRSAGFARSSVEEVLAATAAYRQNSQQARATGETQVMQRDPLEAWPWLAPTR